MCYCVFSLIVVIVLFYKSWSDPVSDLISKIVQLFNSYFGIKLVISLVGRYTSNKVEGPNKQILRHLKAFVQNQGSESP